MKLDFLGFSNTVGSKRKRYKETKLLPYHKCSYLEIIFSSVLEYF